MSNSVTPLSRALLTVFGELVARHGAGLVEGHEAEPDRADLNSSYGVVSQFTLLHTVTLPEVARANRGYSVTRTACRRS